MPRILACTLIPIALLLIPSISRGGMAECVLRFLRGPAAEATIAEQLKDTLEYQGAQSDDSRMKRLLAVTAMKRLLGRDGGQSFFSALAGVVHGRPGVEKLAYWAPESIKVVFSATEVTLKGSNENYARFFEALKENGNSGGAYIGLGTWQNYDFVAFFGSDGAYLYDRDPAAIMAHLIVSHVAKSAATPEEFLSFFKPANSEKNRKLIESEFDDPVYKILRIGRLFEQLARAIYEHGNLHLFLSSQYYYDRFRKPILAGKFHLYVGNHAKGLPPSLMNDVRRDGLQVSAIYASNALEPVYSKSARAFAKTVKALPLAPKGIFLSTWRPAYSHRDIGKILKVSEKTVDRASVGNQDDFHVFEYFILPLSDLK